MEKEIEIIFDEKHEYYPEKITIDKVKKFIDENNIDILNLSNEELVRLEIFENEVSNLRSITIFNAYCAYHPWSIATRGPAIFANAIRQHRSTRGRHAIRQWTEHNDFDPR